tara:strand:- start:422 stop:628 length:207 start_codon:yes stop_codon:yes gene_type:complete
MGEFFSNVSRYPKYFISIVIGALYGIFQPIFSNANKPTTIIFLISALISGCMTLGFIVKAMVLPNSIT